MEIVKNIAAVLGLIVSFGAVISLFSKTFRNFISSIFSKYGANQDIRDMKKSLEEIKESLDSLKSQSDITMEFTRTECRDIVKNMFYKYHDKKELPLYELKMLLKVEDLYINKCHGNSFAEQLIVEMKQWSIDYGDVQLDTI